MVIIISPRFEKNYKKLPVEIKIKAKAKESIFRLNPFDPRLRTHKLHGKEREHWAFCIDQSYRIKFLFIAKDEVLFLDVGTHSIYI